MVRAHQPVTPVNGLLNRTVIEVNALMCPGVGSTD